MLDPHCKTEVAVRLAVLIVRVTHTAVQSQTSQPPPPIHRQLTNHCPFKTCCWPITNLPPTPQICTWPTTDSLSSNANCCQRDGLSRWANYSFGAGTPDLRDFRNFSTEFRNSRAVKYFKDISCYKDLRPNFKTSTMDFIISAISSRVSWILGGISRFSGHISEIPHWILRILGILRRI